MNTEDLPKTLHEATLYFAKGDNALNFMVELRWPNGKPTCPRCGCEDNRFISTRKLWECKGCKKQFSVKVGTVFEDSPIKLDKWLCALWLISNAKNGISSYEIHRALGVTQKTAWFMLHRIRLALNEGSFEKMSGEVEADETYIGPKADKMNKKARKGRPSGRGMVGKAIVQGLLERRPKSGKSSRVKLMVIKNPQRKTIQPNVREYVLKGSHVMTDTLASYVGLAGDYVHDTVNHLVTYVKGNVHTNGMENFWSLLKRMIRGTYVCPSPMHLKRYLDEQAFRFNERRDNDQGRFIKGLSGIVGRRITYKQLISEDQSLPSAA